MFNMTPYSLLESEFPAAAAIESENDNVRVNKPVNAWTSVIGHSSVLCHVVVWFKSA